MGCEKTQRDLDGCGNVCNLPPTGKGQVCPDRTVGAGGTLQVVSRSLVRVNRREEPRGDARCSLDQVLYFCLKVQQAL